MPKQNDKIQREQMRYTDALLFLTTEIDRQIMKLNGSNIVELNKFMRGVNTLEARLRPFMDDTHTKKCKEQNGKMGKKVTNTAEWAQTFNACLEKYAHLHVMMGEKNMLMTEEEGSEA